MQRDPPPPPPLFVYKGTSLTFVWKTGSIHLFNCFQNRPLDAENLRHLLPMCCFHKPHHTLFMPPVSQQSTTNNNFSPFFPSVSRLHAVFLPTHWLIYYISNCIQTWWTMCFPSGSEQPLEALKLNPTFRVSVFCLLLSQTTAGIWRNTTPTCLTARTDFK